MNKRSQGFSLVEILVGLFLSALLLSVLCPLLQVSTLSYRQQLIRTNLHQNLRHAMESMTYELRWADAIQRPAVDQAESYIMFTRINNNKLEEQVVFQKGTTTGEHPDTLYKVIANNSPSPMTENLMVELAFQRVGSRTVRIRVLMRDPVMGIEEEFSGWVECLNVPDQ